MRRLALISVDAQEVREVLMSSAPRESGCFMLLTEGRGRNGSRLLATTPIFGDSDSWDHQGDSQLRPSARYVSQAISKAIDAQAGLLFIHTHPHSHHPPGFSSADVDAITSLGETIGPMLDGPFAAAVVNPEGWSATLHDDGSLERIDGVFAVGRTLTRLDHHPTSPSDLGNDHFDSRQRDALGRAHDLLRSLHIGVVGVGGIGSPLVEQLLRMGVRELTIIDSDMLDTDSNLRRVFGATMPDLRATVPPPKVDVVGAHVDRIGLDTVVNRVFGDVREESVFRRLLDTDVVMSATDTHGSRAIINDLASTYLLPVIDVGVQAGGTARGELAALVAEVRILTPVTPCLWCREVISADVVRAENLPEDERGRLIQEGYLVGFRDGPAPSVAGLTVLASGLASCALLSLLTSEGEVCPSGYLIDGLMGDSLEIGPSEPLAHCRCRIRLGAGDSQPPSFVDVS